MTPTRPNRPVPSWRAALVTGAAVVFVACLTLGPGRNTSRAAAEHFTCLFGCDVESTRDLISNVLLFLPLGWALRYWLRRGSVVGVCFAVSAVIELLQATVIAGRDSSLRDILGNTLGGLAGAVLFDQWRRLCWPTRHAAWRLGLAATAGWVSVLFFTGWGLHQPAPGPPWFGAWAPVLEDYVTYPGRLLSARLEGEELADGPLDAATRTRAAIQAGTFQLHLVVVSGPQPPGVAPIFRINDGSEPEVLQLAQDRRALWLHVRSRLDRWQFRPIVLRLPLFPGRDAGDTVHISAGAEARTLFLSAAAPTESDEIRVPLTVGWAWSALLPVEYPIWQEWVVVNPLWLAVLAWPMGYWLGHAGTRRATGLAAVGLAAGLGVIPLLSDAAPTTLQEWGGASLALLVAVAMGRRAQRNTPASGD